MRNLRRSRLWLAVFTALGLTATALAADPVALIAANSSWRFFPGTSEPAPADPAAWRNVAFTDDAWVFGNAPFWYGEPTRFSGTGFELTDMQNRYTTLYLRQRFSVVNPAAWESLELSAMCDDGFAAWINGVPVAALRAPPAGEPAHDSLAADNAPEPVGFTPFSLPEPETFLQPGENVLAVQVFNVSAGSSDLVFDAELSATPRAAGPPLVVGVFPPPGPLTALDSITVTFSEAVRGVRAEDLLINGASATGVVGDGIRFTFTFPTPAYGPVDITWSTFHAIEDLGNPPQRFELAAPGSTWAYELVDPIGPSVSVVQPPPGTTVNGLAQVEVTFNKAVTGLDAADLTLNGVAAARVAGLGAGPYRFEFPAAADLAPGTVTAAWSATHGIVSDTLDPHPLQGVAWNYTLDPQSQPAALILNEFMAENFTALRDEEQDPEDWIEIHNPTATAVSLAGWSLSNSEDDPGRWVFPAVTVAPGGYLVVFASAKDRRDPAFGKPLHTNFKLNPNGGYLGLFAPELPRQAVSQVAYTEQGPNYSLGREANTGEWRYFLTGTPGAPNSASTIHEAVGDVRFSVPRGFFNAAFNLTLTCPTRGAHIRYTLDGSPPTETTGQPYTEPIPIGTSRVVRAAAFKTDALPSRVATHTYLMRLTNTRLRLPALSLVTATNNLYGRSGIMEVSPRNTTKHGPAWERPVSVEYLRVEDNDGFQVDCGLRIQGGDYVRGQYNYRSGALPFSKYSYRLYFRGEYGKGRLNYPLIPGTTEQSFDTLVLRAGMNDHSNPFVTDELVRSLARDCGQPAPLGTFVHLFLNGVYKGYYNPCERIDIDFLRAYHGGGAAWDLIAQSGEVREGTATYWNSLRTLANTRDLTDPTNYQALSRHLDLTNFVDYLCPLIYVDNDDWPHNNWRAAREQADGAPFRLYVWDAEWACGNINGHSPNWDTIRNQLSSTSPPWGGTDIQRLFNSLKRSPEFRMLFADRVTRHFFNGGALTDERIRARYTDVTNRLNGVVNGFNDRIGRTWIPQRRRYVLQHLERAGFLASSNAPVFGQHGGRVPAGYPLTLSNLAGTIYYTTNGTDPRVAFTEGVAPDALPYHGPLEIVTGIQLRARSLQGTNWSALTEASFEVDQPGVPLRITEILYHPPGGDAFEFLELANLGHVPLDLSGFSFTGVSFRFPEPTPLMAPGARWVLANDTRPADFLARYPDVVVAGWFGGSLANGGEEIQILDPHGVRVTAIAYGDTPPWPSTPDGNGPSLEILREDGDPSDPATWTASLEPGGTPGLASAPSVAPRVRLSEIVPGSATSADWVEVHNAGPEPVSLEGWGLSDNSNPQRFVFPAGTTIPPGGRIRVWCDLPEVPDDNLHTGFALDRDGETLALYDPAATRVDAVTFGFIPEAFSLGRIDDRLDWQLTEPTPEAPNEAANLAAPNLLSLNEWLANPPPGQDDWLELHNRHRSLPIALEGLYFQTANGLARFSYPAFVPPSGFLVLRADGTSGADRVALRLPASGGPLTLLDTTGRDLTGVTLAATGEGLTVGRWPDGTGVPVPFPGSPSPGASNYLANLQGPVFNEWMARNQGSVLHPSGHPADWIEFHNPTADAFDLSGSQLILRDGDSEHPWSFPTATQLPALGYLVVWADPELPPTDAAGHPPFNLGRGLPADGATLELRDKAGRILDAVEFGHQLADRSVGRIDETLNLLATPTPGSANSGPLTLASADSVRLNEWMAAPRKANDWLELFNPEPLPVDLGGFSLTDDPSLSGITKHRLPPLTFLPPLGHVMWDADGQPERGANHLAFRLDAEGETLRLYSAAGQIVDGLEFESLPANTAFGRFPDGSLQFSGFPDSASPGRSNWQPHPGVVIEEILAHTDPPLEDAIKIRNPSGRQLNLAGWWLSDDVEALAKYQIPQGVRLPAGSRQVFYEYQFNAPEQEHPFSLNSAHGGEVWLSEVDAFGQLTGYRSRLAFGATVNGRSVGLQPTSTGFDVAPLSQRAFGQDAPASLAEFRRGTGLPNAEALIGPVVLSEIRFRSQPGDETLPEPLAGGEFVELHNRAAESVPLFDPAAPTHTWRLRGGIQFDLPPAAFLPAGGFALIVPFDPGDATASEVFRARFQVPTDTALYGPFSGRLADEGDEVRLERPDTPQAPPHPDAGFVPYVLVERVDASAWNLAPALLDIQDSSLQRRRVTEFANDPAHWITTVPSAGAEIVPPIDDLDLDGMRTDWESAYNLDPNDPADASLDADGDGLSNLDEFRAGTDPRNAASVFRLNIASESGTGLALRFTAAIARTYQIQRRVDAEYGTWQTVFEVSAEPDSREVRLPLQPEPAGRVFYRVIVTPDPTVGGNLLSGFR